jgi:thiol-disulfide isomerase/thioredoxin
MAQANPPPARQKRLLKPWWIGVAIAALGLAAFRGPIQRSLSGSMLFRADSPADDTFNEWIQTSPSPSASLRRAWRDGGIPHRTLALKYIHERVAADPGLGRETEDIAAGATRDPDLSIRELGLGILVAQKSRFLPAIVATMLHDADPSCRLDALQYTSRLPDPLPVALAGPLLKDPSLEVALSSAGVLRGKTGIDFGARLSMAKSANAAEAATNQAAATAALAKWNEWWSIHRAEFPARPVSSPTVAPPAARATADFQLPDLGGKIVRLSDFRGKVVVVNFWATWCESCLEELPELNQLRHQHPDDLVILGIALDGVADAEGEHSEAATGAAQAMKAVQKFAAKIRVDYPILLDPQAAVGRRFNGGELPTNVIIDPRGVVKRRFVGRRELAVWESLLGEAGLPAQSRAPSAPTDPAPPR